MRHLNRVWSWASSRLAPTTPSRVSAITVQRHPRTSDAPVTGPPTTASSSRGTLEAIDVDAVQALLERYNTLNWDRDLPPGAAHAR